MKYCQPNTNTHTEKKKKKCWSSFTKSAKSATLGDIACCHAGLFLILSNLRCPAYAVFLKDALGMYEEGVLQFLFIVEHWNESKSIFQTPSPQKFNLKMTFKTNHRTCGSMSALLFKGSVTPAFPYFSAPAIDLSLPWIPPRIAGWLPAPVCAANYRQDRVTVGTLSDGDLCSGVMGRAGWKAVCCNIGFLH